MEKERKEEGKKEEGWEEGRVGLSGRQPSAQSGPGGTRGSYTCSKQLATASPWTGPPPGGGGMGSSAADWDQEGRSEEEKGPAAGRRTRTTSPPS